MAFYKRQHRGGIFRGSKRQRGGYYRGSRRQRGGYYRGSKRQRGGKKWRKMSRFPPRL